MMATHVRLYSVTLIAFLAIDAVWLGLVALTFYDKHLCFLLAPSPNWLGAILFYLLFVIGILVFAVLPGLGAKSLKTTLMRGALLGLIAYATYDLTNLATVKDWPLTVTVVDLIWGTVLSTAVSYVGYAAGRRLS